MKFYLKILSFLPALCMICLIFSFSGQSGEQSAGLSLKISTAVIKTADQVFHLELSEEKQEEYISLIHTPIRKLAHMSEYCIFAFTLLFPLYLCGMRGLPLFFTVILCCAAFAGTDEYHQSFVDGRGPSIRDVCIDTLGAFIGTLVFFGIHHIRRKHSAGGRRS